jgi:CBS domain-containing protein
MTVTIGTLDSASGGVVSVPPDAPIMRAQSLMESNDFSQLAVMTGERNLKGAISWESIARSSLYGKPPEFVRDAMDKEAVVVADSAPLLEHVVTIADAGFVFVRDATNVIKGIVTAADLSMEFAKQANPFLLLGEVEGWLRQIVDRDLDADDLAAYVDPADPDRQIEAASSLTFGEYVRLLQDPVVWDRLGLQADRAVFCDHLEDVRRIRNSIMHFSPDPLPDSDLERINTLLRWVRKLANGR